MSGHVPGCTRVLDSQGWLLGVLGEPLGTRPRPEAHQGALQPPVCLLGCRVTPGPASCPGTHLSAAWGYPNLCLQGGSARRPCPELSSWVLTGALSTCSPTWLRRCTRPGCWSSWSSHQLSPLGKCRAPQGGETLPGQHRAPVHRRPWGPMSAIEGCVPAPTHAKTLKVP